MRWATLAVLGILAGTAMVSAQDLFGRVEDTVPDDVEAIYLKGLTYLDRNLAGSGAGQDNYGNQPGVVGLAVVAMLAHGDDPNTGPYHAAIKRGLDFILKGANGNNGYLGSSMYNHGFATLALAESYGMV